MGEWSDYFEDFPEENPANYVGERFDPQGAKERAKQSAQLSHDQYKLDSEIREIIAKHKKAPSP